MRRLRIATWTSGEPVSDLWIRNCVITFPLASLASAIRESILLVYNLNPYVYEFRITRNAALGSLHRLSVGLKRPDLDSTNVAQLQSERPQFIQRERAWNG